MDISSIQKRIKMIEDLEGENRTLKDMIDSQLEADGVYQEAAKEAKQKGLEKKSARDRVLSDPGNQKTISDMKANQEEIATLKEILSTELVDFYNKSKQDEIDDGSGVARKFKFSVKLMPKRDFQA